MQPIKKKLVAVIVFFLVAAGAKRKKARVRIFCKNYLCNSNVLFIFSAFLFLLYINRQPLKGLALINHLCFI